MTTVADDIIDAEHTALATYETARPIATPQEAKASMEEYLKLCEAVLDPVTDYQEFTQKGVTKRFKKKSAVKKLQTFFGVEVTVKDATRDDLGDGHFAFRVIASARTRGGRVVEATGACSTFEERFDLSPFDNEPESKFAYRQRKALARSYHDVLSTAETRATNRAVMNAIGVGGGEVTADEIQRPSKGPERHRPFIPAATPASVVEHPQAVRKDVETIRGMTKDEVREKIDELLMNLPEHRRPRIISDATNGRAFSIEGVKTLKDAKEVLAALLVASELYDDERASAKDGHLFGSPAAGTDIESEVPL